ncbi:MAG: 30S ribosomal protein S16 [Stygiobacter sp. RIFOXYC12_FULL_38_8]|nr:MAG: 30S ribosomal protein S16 [Stygiobacter sp. GWC2_38_9]OGV09161.1 MAG: 30S ribosomal protein S16 [Stygiobacter sp. RIFOXYB2_FULL_37_11]OGV14192.1 MAG: 30S ribosomal protein S16 [Stygiobacter sp. RIFOXYA2_FULL_38_8]OGV16392.1 MAG: 30S ribosomal protein S16 [Stygiobacter sp. RIFOXYC2_FULL_38_25]OGV26738.1 MAG: 30S ribosomal protein S16 [Stygiobacter sp. RIFOXYC12_FULL_38_8]OGV81734.1 MAG: 30S ribosomal protein S16 [Stygiobacter sp. GWF2_38_21]OGV91561.1 MAG: 30S ribosomal protein S16 [Me
MGKKKQPIYKVVAADARSPRDGKFIEAIGLYNPKTEPATIEIKESRAMYWLNVGAQPTVTVKNLLSGQGIILRRELLKKGLKEEEVAAKLEEWKKLTEANLAAKLKKKADKKKSKKALAKEKSQGATEA